MVFHLLSSVRWAGCENANVLLAATDIASSFFRPECTMNTDLGSLRTRRRLTSSLCLAWERLRPLPVFLLSHVRSCTFSRTEEAPCKDDCVHTLAHMCVNTPLPKKNKHKRVWFWLGNRFVLHLIQKFVYLGQVDFNRTALHHSFKGLTGPDSQSLPNPNPTKRQGKRIDVKQRGRQTPPYCRRCNI